MTNLLPTVAFALTLTAFSVSAWADADPVAQASARRAELTERFAEARAALTRRQATLRARPSSPIARRAFESVAPRPLPLHPLVRVDARTGLIASR